MKTNSSLHKIALFLFILFAQKGFSATFTVSNLNNTGAGSLRQAITDANAAGGGGHTIDFSVSGVITLLSNLPVISNNNITIDGLGQSITVSANGGDIARYVFRGNAGADFLTIKNLEIKNTGYEAFRFDGSPTDVTIENIRWYNESGNYYNYGINYVGNALNLSIINVIAEDQQNYGAVVEITGTATNLLIDNLTFDNTLSYHYNTEVVRINGAASNCTIQNCDWNLDNGLSTNDSDYGIYFNNTVSNCTIRNVNIFNCEVYPIFARLAVNGLHISQLNTTNGDGYGGAYGIRFNSSVNDLSLDTVSFDLDHSTSTNDGDYGIYFNNTASNVSIDSLVINDAEIYGIYVGSTATNFSIQHARLDNFDGGSTQQAIRFQGNVSNVSLTNMVIDGDISSTTNDGDYGLWFNSGNVVGVELINVQINEFDGDGIRMYEVDDLFMDSCTLSNNYDGFELYNGHDRLNNIIKNSTFSGNTRGGLLINVANATNEFQIDSNEIYDNTTGIWLYSTGGVKDIQIRNNEIYNNSTAGIYNEQADGVLYSQNSIYNNTMGIDNVANNGNNDLENADGDVPFLSSSVNIGGGNYDVTFTLPAICNTNDCDVEFYTNEVGDAFLNGRNYVASQLSLGAGGQSVTLNSGGNTSGFWTATLKVSSLNNSVSEFSDALVIQPEYPAGVGSGIALWMSADKDITDPGTAITEWKDRAGVHTPAFIGGDPDLIESGTELVNFNPTVHFDGNDYFRWDGDLFTNSFTSGEVFTVQKEHDNLGTGNGNAFRMGGASNFHYTWNNQYIYANFGCSNRKVWRPNNGTLSLSEGTANGATLTGPLRNTTAYMVNNLFSETNNWQCAFNGTTALTDITNTTNFSGTPYLGYSGSYFYGNLTEIVLYNRVLNTDERERVNTYMAIKYGVTLEHNYYASDWNGTTGTTFWTIGSGYDNDIAGIARDDNGSLLQKQAQSINEGAILSVYNQDQSGGLFLSNKASTATPSADKSALLWGNNGSNIDFAVAYTPFTFTPPPSTAFFHMNRIWQVQETGTIGLVTLTIPYTTRAEYLLVHNSSNFGVGTPTEIPLINDGLGNLYAVLDLADGQFFTFGANRKAPGCVAGGLRLWLDADYPTVGITNGLRWEDQTINDLNVDQTAAGETASYNSSADEIHNFHPYIEFDGNDNFETDAQVLQSATSNGSAFFVAKYDNFSGWDSPIDFQADNPHIGRYAGSDDPVLYNAGSSPTFFRAIDLDIIQAQNQVSGYLWSGGTNGGCELTLDGDSALNTTMDFNNIGYTSNFGVGSYISGAEGINGTMSEVIIYETRLTPNEKYRVESYLAIKYGASLSHDYLSGASTVIWSTGNGFDENIAGIGREDCQGLYQKQSKSVNTGSIPAIYLGDQTNGLPQSTLANTATFSNDDAFMLWGSNGAASSYTGTYPSNSFIDIMERKWLIDETSTVGLATVVPSDSTADVLLIDSDGDFTDGNSIEILLENGMTTYDFTDGDYFTFGKLTCNTVSTIACATSFAIDLSTYVQGYTPGGSWSEETASGADISDPNAVDFSAVPLGSYTFTYKGPGIECHEVIIEKLNSIPAPMVSDILTCEGGSTNLTIPTPPDREELIWEEDFTGNYGYKIRSYCTGSDVSTCYNDNSGTLSNVGLKLDESIDFSSWNSGYWSWVWNGANRLGFGRLRDVEISLTTDSVFTLLPDETMIFSGQSERWWGNMEADDYVKFFYVVDGVETEFDSRNGNISTAFQTSTGSYTNNSGSPQQIEMRIKVKNSWNEGHRIDNLKITKILAPPVFSFYDDANLSSLLANGLNFDPMTAPGSIDTIYVTRTENGCESLADTVTVEVSPNNVSPMEGEPAYYCAGGTGVDLTAHVSNYQAGGTWFDDNASGVDLSDPTNVDVSSLADDSYNFSYELNGIAPCNGEKAIVTINVGLLPTPPILDDIFACEGASTKLVVQAPEAMEEILYDETFNGSNGDYILLGRCTNSASASCRIDDAGDFANRGLTLDTSATDFSNWTRWATWVYDVNELRFGRMMDEEIVLSTDSFTLLNGEVANFSGDSRRYFGVMEASDYVKFFYVIDGVETEFDSREGNISTAFSTSAGFYENNTGLPVYIQLRVKVKNSWAEGHIVDNLKISKTLNKPINNFYDDAGLTTLLASGYSYDPGTTAGSSDTIYVTTLQNACESIADTVYIRIDTSTVEAMDGEELSYCGGSSTDLTSLITTFVSGGTWSDLDGSGVDLSDASNVDFSAVSDGSYNYSYSVSGSCGDEEAIVTVHIGLLGKDPYIVQDGLVANALTECVSGNWIYFLDPLDETKRIAAINTNGNSIDPSAFAVTVDVDAPESDLRRANGSGANAEAVHLMRRFVQINCPSCDTLSPAVDVRLYWNTYEKDTAGIQMDAWMTSNSITGSKAWDWFKVSHDAADIPANLTGAGITDNSGTARAWASPDLAGVEINGVDYIQFNNIETFSTFGGGWHVNQVDGSVLPVELVYLNAKTIDNKDILVSWATTTEINNEGFEIQRSIDGLNFETIAWVDGNGNSHELIEYQYKDRDLVNNIYYYRLKQYDFDGVFKYSPIVSAKIVDSDETDFQVMLLPNPSSGFGKLSIQSNKSVELKISIFDSMGRKVIETKSLVYKGQNQIDLSNYSYIEGVYNVIVTQPNNKPVNLKWVLIND